MVDPDRVFFISHKRIRVWIRYFTRLCTIISSTCVIFFCLDDFFAMVCTSFHEGCGFHHILSTVLMEFPLTKDLLSILDDILPFKKIYL
jgi:hypothetical protein